ncbi:nitric oxide reductase transcriptional regulator NorR [Myxococcota bacterium]|nr:nitric oxide reductase transcriptional regulator NorR [Myxococcota bacterium]
MSTPSPLLEIATDLCANLAAEDRYRRLLDAVRRVVPCDAAALLRVEDDVLVPASTLALRPETMGIRFAPAQHPRLAAILAARGPVRFTGTRLPDPFDGLLQASPDALSRVHACMGAPLLVEGRVVGVLTLDALDPTAFDAVRDDELALFAGLAAAATRTAGLIEAIEATAARHGMVARQLVREARQRGGELVGRSDAMSRLREEIHLLAGSDLTALVSGETGVGKELVVSAIHAASARAQQPLVHVNCAALPESVAESELFGHTRGAFTGAHEARAGKFEVAHGGTLFLDEVGELPLSIQPKLLRVLQSGELQRVGSDVRIQVDVRVVAATNRDLAAEVRAGRFRADLYHRLAVYPLAVPPLRERPDDVPVLAGYFLDLARVRIGLGPVRLSPAALRALEAWHWPGNVRELEHLLLRATLKASGGRRRETVVVEPAHLDLPVGATVAEAPRPPPVAVGLPYREAMDEAARQLVRQALEDSGGSWTEAARRLGLDRSNLHRLAGRLGLRGDHRGGVVPPTPSSAGESG